MEKFELNGLLNEYLKLSKEEAALKEKKDNLKSQIIAQMGDEKKYDNGFASATVVLKNTFKYNDEVGIINYLKNNGYGCYVVEKVDTSLNKVLQTETPLTEALQPMFTKSIVESLTVKELTK